MTWEELVEKTKRNSSHGVIYLIGKYNCKIIGSFQKGDVSGLKAIRLFGLTFPYSNYDEMYKVFKKLQENDVIL